MTDREALEERVAEAMFHEDHPNTSVQWENYNKFTGPNGSYISMARAALAVIEEVRGGERAIIPTCPACELVPLTFDGTCNVCSYDIRWPFRKQPEPQESVAEAREAVWRLVSPSMEFERALAALIAAVRADTIREEFDGDPVAMRDASWQDGVRAEREVQGARDEALREVTDA